MSLCEKLIEKYGPEINAVPSIQYIWEAAQSHVLKNDEVMIKKYQNLIYLLHNSFVSPYTRLGKNVKFGYGGIGVVLHKSSLVGNNVVISQNVTIGGSAGSSAVNEEGKVFYAPDIRSNVYIACGSKILGAVIIRDFCIIGANSVVLNSTDKFSIYAGAPAKKIKSLNKSNCLTYKAYFSVYAEMKKEDFIALFPD